MGIRTTVVGSWWPYADETEELAKYHRGELSAEDGDTLLNRCATRAIKEQRDFGFDEWTGGEYFCDNFLLQVQKTLTGVEIDVAPRVDEYDYDDLGHLVITGDIGCPEGLGYAKAYERERNLEGGVPKATLISPFEILIAALDQPEKIQEQMPNLIAIVNKEIRDLAELGCPHIQLDAPLVAVQINEGLLPAEMGAQVIAGCFEGVGNGTTRGLHLCNGNNRGRPASGVVKAAPWIPMLQALDGVIDVANLELSYWAEWQEREEFAALPQSMQVAAGLVDEANYYPMPAQKIAERATEWVRILGEDRLWLQMSCGFGRHTHREADRALLEEKMTNLITAAEKV